MRMSHRIGVFGEVLFDHFPSGERVLGGAPFNVAWHLHAFGAAPFFISRIADDDDGESVLAAMQAWGMETDGLQRSAPHPTGRVSVEFEGGEPVYDILAPAAYDAIEPDPVRNASFEILYHGSLALRSSPSQETAAQLRRDAAGRIFVDVNLRPPWWERARVLEMLHGTQWVKLNADELTTLHPGKGDIETRASDFLETFGLEGMILTRGNRGAEVLEAGGRHFEVRPRRNVEVVNSVGAGDAFSSVVLLGMLRSWPRTETLERAQDFASAIVGCPGATVADAAFYRHFVDSWRS